ncbi:hypothetical protein [Janibacter massiliensis]|uniref:hypothetical protein n=1 Tax=Janibacter massiliensis TaxID=2058291 RepID=UPI000D103212|nr:hypothetical protein [Janibacter massiliensis]
MLVYPVDVESHSDDLLCTAVRQQLAQPLTPDIGPVPALDRPLRTRVPDILLRLGLVMSAQGRTGGGRTRSTDALWPILKYFHFFRRSRRGGLLAGPDAARYRHHSRGAVSDELGMAFSLLAAERWIVDAGLIPGNIVDLERHPGPLALNLARGRRPDFGYEAFDLGTMTPRWLTVEAKGASAPASETRAAKQLADAHGQITALPNISGLASVTFTGRGPVSIWAVAAPAEEPLDPVLADFFKFSAGRRRHRPEARLRHSISALAAWSGVNMLLGQEREAPVEYTSLRDEWMGHLDVYGRRGQLEGLEIFRGIDAPLAESLLKGDVDMYLSARVQLAEQWFARQSRIDEDDYRELYEPGSTTWVTALAPNGAILAIRGRVKVPERDPRATRLEEMDDE